MAYASTGIFDRGRARSISRYPLTLLGWSRSAEISEEVRNGRAYSRTLHASFYPNWAVYERRKRLSWEPGCGLGS